MSDQNEQGKGADTKLIQVRFGNADIFIDGGGLLDKLTPYLPAMLRKSGGRFDPLRFALGGMIARELPNLRRQIAADLPGYPLPDPPRHTDLVAYMLDYYTQLMLAQLSQQVIVLEYRRAQEYGANAVEITGASSAAIVGRVGLPAPTMDAGNGPSAEALAGVVAATAGQLAPGRATETGDQAGSSGRPIASEPNREHDTDGEAVTPAGTNPGITS